MPVRERVEQLLQAVKAVPEISHLGTPMISLTDEVRQILQLGQAAVPVLIESLNRDNVQQAAHAAYALSELGATEAIPALTALRQRLQGKSPKDRWDYAALGQVNAALNKLKAGVTPDPAS